MNTANNSNRILVVVDVNADEHPAIDRAMSLARQLGMGIDLFSCQHETPLASDALGTFVAYETNCEERLQAVLQKLRELAAPYAEQGIDISIDAAWDTPQYEGIIREAVRTRARYVLKETHYHSAIARALFSNTDWQLIRNCPAPVWLVKHGNKLDAPKIIAAVDPMHENAKPTSLDLRILSEAASLAEQFDGQLHAVHIFDTSPLIAAAATSVIATGPIPVEDITHDAAQTHAKALHELADQFGLPESNVHMPAGLTSDLLPHIARELDASLVIMGAISRSRLERVFVGSTAERVLDHLPCDTLIVKPSGFTSSIDATSAPASYRHIEQQHVFANAA